MEMSMPSVATLGEASFCFLKAASSEVLPTFPLPTNISLCLSQQQRRQLERGIS